MEATLAGQELTNGVVLADVLSNLQLGADAVSSTDQNGVCVSRCFKVKEAAKTSDVGISPRSARAFNHCLDAVNKGIPGFNVNAC